MTSQYKKRYSCSTLYLVIILLKTFLKISNSSIRYTQPQPSLYRKKERAIITLSNLRKAKGSILPSKFAFWSNYTITLKNSSKLQLHYGFIGSVYHPCYFVSIVAFINRSAEMAELGLVSQCPLLLVISSRVMVQETREKGS